MPEYIFKTEGDLYLLWSTVVDALTAVGTRDEIEGFLLDREIERAKTAISERLERADETGTSARHPTAPWHREQIWVSEGPGGPGVLHRDNLHEYAKAILEDDEDRAALLVAPESL